METQIEMNNKAKIAFLLEEIKRLRRRIEELENQRGFVTQPVLEKIWDNEYDAEWDEF